MYDPQAETKLSTDGSSYELGVVLLQSNGDDRKPVAHAYTSRVLSDAVLWTSGDRSAGRFEIEARCNKASIAGSGDSPIYY